jgi:hypothetical protein
MSGARDRAAPGARVLAATREELVRADAKATTLFATTGVAVGALLSGLLSGQWSPLRLQAGAPAWLWWAGAAATVAALTALAGAMYPRTRRSRARTDVAAYFGDVVRIGRDELDRALAVPDTAVVVDQVYEISVIVARKYALIKMALVLTALSVALFITAVLLNGTVGSG